MKRRLAIVAFIAVMSTGFATTTAGLCCISVNGQTFCSNTDGGGGGGGGGTPVPTPTPDKNQLFNDLGATQYTGPVPDAIQTATGESTWAGVIAWMDQQFQAAGVNVNTTTGATVDLHVENGAITLVEGTPPGTDTPGPTETPTP